MLNPKLITEKIMLCDVCGKKAATVHLTEIIEGKTTEIHLCEGCAKKKTEEVQKQFSIAGFLSDLTDLDLDNKESAGQIKCSNCGLTYQEFKKTGKLGCYNCYADFKTFLAPLLKKVHGAGRHKGKSQDKGAKNLSVQERINKLKEFLNRAVELEEYEEAARLRDQIKELQKQAESNH